MYLLAILLPPVAVLIAGKPLQAFIALLLWPFGLVPAMVYGIAVVSEYKSRENALLIARAVRQATRQPTRAGHYHDDDGDDFNFS